MSDVDKNILAKDEEVCLIGIFTDYIKCGCLFKYARITKIEIYNGTS